MNTPIRIRYNEISGTLLQAKNSIDIDGTLLKQ